MRFVIPLITITLAILAFGNFFWCPDGLIAVKSIDGFVLWEPAIMSDADIEKQLAWHDAIARQFFEIAGVQGDPVEKAAPDGLVYAFPPDTKPDYVERTLVSLYPRPMAHAIAYGLPVTDTLPEDAAYRMMIASGTSVSEAASVRDGNISRVYRKSYAEEMRKREIEHQHQLASRKPLSSLSAKERIAEARRDRRWIPCNFLTACGLVR